MSAEQILEQRLREIAAADDEGLDWTDVQRRAGKRLPMRRMPRRRLALALAATVVVASSLTGVFVAYGTRGTPPSGSGGQTGLVGPGGPFTLENPLPSGETVSLSEAASSLGGTIVLPDTGQVTASDVGAVWMAQSPADGPASRGGSTGVAVTFPSQGLIIRYERPTFPHSLANYRNFVSQSPGSEVVYLNHGVPALAIALLPDGSNWGSVQFVAGGTTIVVMGHSSEAFLQDVSQSILDRTSG